MSYSNDYFTFLDAFSNNKSIIADNCELFFYENHFVSKRGDINHYYINPHSSDYLTHILFKYFLKNNSFSQKYIFPIQNDNTDYFNCNNEFPYRILHPKDGAPAKEVIFLLHGLNERDWKKYLTWAYKLQKDTGKSVLLFPLSFHMERAPVEWSASRLMNEVAKERANLIPDLRFSSYANSALSTRLNFEPERFFLSGIQSLFDIVQLVDEVKEGNNKYIDKNAQIDFLGYSAGAFLGELLFMVNPKNYFDSSKLLMICGGSVIEETYPCSKAILDTEAAKVFREYYLNDFETSVSRNNYLTELFNKYEDIGIIFKSMLSFDKNKSLRNSLLKGLNKRIFVIGLEKDTVYSPKGIKKMFNGMDEKYIKILDFDYNYLHEKIFHEKCAFDDKVTEAFNYTFSLMANFYNQN